MGKSIRESAISVMIMISVVCGARRPASTFAVFAVFAVRAVALGMLLIGAFTPHD